MHQGFSDFDCQIPGLGSVAVLQLLGKRLQDGAVLAGSLEQSSELGVPLVEIRTLPRHAALDLIWLLDSLF